MDATTSSAFGGRQHENTKPTKNLFVSSECWLGGCCAALAASLILKCTACPPVPVEHRLVVAVRLPSVRN